jgi:hypothetical protein
MESVIKASARRGAVGTIGPQEDPPMPETRTRTTLDLSPALWLRAKRRALEEGKTLRQLLLEGLDLRLSKPKGWQPK